MRVVVAKAELTKPRQRLIELMQTLAFGRIETLHIRGGDPVFEPPPTMIRDLKLGGQNGPRDERALNDFALKVQVIELFDQLDRFRDGVIDVLTIKHGLPFHMQVSLPAGAC